MLIFLVSLMFIFMMMIFFEKNIILNLNFLENLNLELEMNLMNQIFSFMVIFISIMILKYLKFYFHYIVNFLFKLNFLIFVISMIILINGNSLVPIIIGWDGLGISSFFLISFYSNEESMNSSLITFFFNRLGDSFLMIFFSMMLMNSNSKELFKLNLFMLTFLLLGLMTKSCQIPFGIWLPMAMAAPTPISSLVHSSTLVTAGIYLMMKINFSFIEKKIMFFFEFFGVFTFLLGGMFAFFMMDLKKAIAFSTLSQLGFIFFSLFLGNFFISFNHLIFHAIFKFSLFMNLGLFMFFNFSIQDSRMMNLKSNNYSFKIFFFFSCLNLMGMVSMSGFLSKDMILINFSDNLNKMLILSILYFGCLLTMCYSLKFMFIFKNKFMFMKLMKSKKMSLFFIGMFFSFFFLLFIPIFFMDFLSMNLMVFISSKIKLMFFFMIIYSLILIKIFFWLFHILEKFSFPLMLMEFIFFYLNFFLEKMKIYILFFQKNDKIQTLILMFILNKNYSKNFMNLFLLNLNMIIYILLFFDIF